MPANISIKKIASIASPATAKLQGVMKPMWRVLTFSPADGTLSPKKSLSVTLEKGTLSVAYGSRFFSRLKIQGIRNYSFEEGKYPTPEGVASSLSFAINEFGAKSAYVSLSIPKAWTVIKIAEFPITVKENLANAVSYELDRLTPFSSEDALYDFRILREHNEKLSILILAARGDLVRSYIDALRENGITVSTVTVNLLNIGMLCSYVYKVEDFIFVEINKHDYEGALYLNGFINEAFTGNFETVEEQSRIDILKERINNLMSFAQNALMRPQIIVLFKENNPKLEEMMKLQFSMPMRVLQRADIPFRGLGYGEEIPLVAIGGNIESLLPHPEGLNLIQKGYQEKPLTPLTFTGVLIFVLIAMWILYLIAPLRIEGKRLEEIDRQLQIRKDDVRKVEVLKKEIETLRNEIFIIEDFKEARPISLDIIKELTVIIPNNTWLTRVRISESTVNIEGYASSASTLLPKLERSNYFKKAEFASPTFRDRRMNADRFNIKMQIEGIMQAGELRNEKE